MSYTAKLRYLPGIPNPYEASHYGDNTVQRNADALADYLDADISICQGCSRSGIPAAIFGAIDAPINAVGKFNAKREGSTRFGRNTSSAPFIQRDRFVQFQQLVNNIHDAVSLDFADNPTRVKLRGKSTKTIAVGWSPYMRQIQLDRKTARATTHEVIGRLADLLFPGSVEYGEPSWRDLYDLVVLGPNETYHYPGRSTTILFVKRDI